MADQTKTIVAVIDRLAEDFRQRDERMLSVLTGILSNLAGSVLGLSMIRRDLLAPDSFSSACRPQSIAFPSLLASFHLGLVIISAMARRHQAMLSLPGTPVLRWATERPLE